MSELGKIIKDDLKCVPCLHDENIMRILFNKWLGKNQA